MASIALLVFLCQGAFALAAANCNEGEVSCMIQMPTNRRESLLEPPQYETTKAVPVGFNLEDAHISDKAINGRMALNEVQLDLQQGLALQADLERYAATLPEGATKELLRSFKLCGSCNNFRRFGEPRDGGYLMCMDHMDGVTAAYSVGVEHHDKWSGDVAGTWKVPVYQMDCTVSQAAEMCPGCKFFRNCLTGSTPSGPQPAWTLTETLQHTGQAAAAERSLFGKIDIEGSEWGAFAAADVSTLKKFRQLVVEFHWLQEVHKHPDYLKAMLKLQLAGFRVVHLHGNNGKPMFDTTDYKIPQVVEVTFDSSAQPIATCLQDQQMHPLDMPNNADKAELPLAHLPSF